MKRLHWRHPEWWSVGICVTAWMWMLVDCFAGSGHSMHHSMVLTTSIRHELGMWLCMVAATMLPLVLDSVKWTAENSLWTRREFGMTSFLFGYFGVWLVAGLVPAALGRFGWTHENWVAAALFAFASLWLSTKYHRRALIDCHRTYPLSPSGWKADWDCLQFGATTGTACIRSCWPFMLGCGLAGHPPAVMAGGMIIAYFERRRFRAGPRIPMTGTFVVAGCYILIALFPYPRFNP